MKDPQYYKELPRYVQEVVKKRVEEQGNNFTHDSFTSSDSFVWSETPEKHSFWRDVLSHKQYHLILEEFGTDLFDDYINGKRFIIWKENKFSNEGECFIKSAAGNEYLFTKVGITTEESKRKFTEDVLGYYKSGAFPYCKSLKDLITLWNALLNKAGLSYCNGDPIAESDFKTKEIYEETSKFISDDVLCEDIICKAGVTYRTLTAIFRPEKDIRLSEISNIYSCWRRIEGVDMCEWKYNHWAVSKINIQEANKEEIFWYDYLKKNKGWVRETVLKKLYKEGKEALDLLRQSHPFSDHMISRYKAKAMDMADEMIQGDKSLDIYKERNLTAYFHKIPIVYSDLDVGKKKNILL